MINQARLYLYYTTKGVTTTLGKHLVEVYTDQYLMGSGSFVVK